MMRGPMGTLRVGVSSYPAACSHVSFSCIGRNGKKNQSVRNGHQEAFIPQSNVANQLLCTGLDARRSAKNDGTYRNGILTLPTLSRGSPRPLYIISRNTSISAVVGRLASRSSRLFPQSSSSKEFPLPRFPAPPRCPFRLSLPLRPSPSRPPLDP